MLRSCLIFFLKSVTVGIITNPILNKCPFKSLCLVNCCITWLTWSFHVQVPWVLQNSITWFCHVSHDLCSCCPLWPFLLVISHLSMVSVGRCVYDMHVVCVWLLHYAPCTIPNTPYHIHMESSTGSNTSSHVVLYWCQHFEAFHA